MNDLTNIASATGTYNNLPTAITSEAVVVALIEGLSITKTTDKQSWANGPLTYTITVDNKAQETYVSPIVTDIIDTTLVSFVDGSVTIDGVKADESKYNYDTDTHTLTINLSDIASSASSIITFQVNKK